LDRVPRHEFAVRLLRHANVCLQPRAHRSEKLTTGHSVLYSHFFVFVGLSILASLIRHAILDDMVESEFRVLSAIGAVCFFIGKQYAYSWSGPSCGNVPRAPR
jgi:hypothetical protein